MAYRNASIPIYDKGERTAVVRIAVIPHKRINLWMEDASGTLCSPMLAMSAETLDTLAASLTLMALNYRTGGETVINGGENP